MGQPALNNLQMPEAAGPPSLSQRLEAELSRISKPEPTVSSMAERFAPDALRAVRDEPGRPFAGDAMLAAKLPEKGRFTAPGRGVIVVLTAVAIAPAALLAGLLWFGAIRGPDANFGFDVPRSAPSAQAAVAAAPGLRATPQPPEIALSAPDTIAAKAGEQVGFAIAIDAAETLPERSVIAIRNLPEGAVFSEGRPYGAHEWSLRPDEIVGLSLNLPENQAVAKDLRVELVSADGTVLARTATRLDVALAPAAGLVVRSDEADRVEDLMAHGRKMIAVGYFAGARAYFQRAAEAGSGEAALAAGATYDPAFTAALGAQGIKPEPEAAMRWYERATALGVTDPDTKLDSLKQDWAQITDSPESAAAPEDAAAAPVEPPTQPRDEEKPGPLGRLVAAASELTSTDQWVEVTSPVNVRADASSDGEILKVVQKGTKLRVKGQEGNWIQVANPATSDEGWIYTRFLKETDAP